MLTVYQSNRLERLAERLARALRGSDGRSPLTPELIVVQNAGVRRWLSMRLAEHLQVCANVTFRTPAELVWQVFRALLADVPERSPNEPEATTWALMGLLARLGDDRRFAPLTRYLGPDSQEQELRRFELAEKLADAFAQLVVFRPDWVRAWERGEASPALDRESADEAWQAELWRRLMRSGMRGRHFARLADELHRSLAHLGDGVALPALPSRISLFGVPALPPATLAVVQHLAHHLELHLFLVNPSRAYWFDIRSHREQMRGATRARVADPAELHLEVGNSLLASFGRQSRDFIASLLAADDDQVRHEEFFESPVDGGSPDLLHALQGDILDLRERRSPSNDAADGAPPDPADPRYPPPLAIGRDDRSLQVHVCHGPMREVEVLHDRLLDLFDRHPELRPSDVVVMTPNIEQYAACIEAVFATSPPDRRIPYSIADRSLAADSPLVATFLAALDLPGSRYEANRILDLLELPALQRRFDLDPEQVELVQRWVRDTGIRWGIDGERKAELELPESGENTWRFGLDRLLLGYALPGGGERLFAGILPYDEVEGVDARTLGRLATLLDALFALDRELAQARSPSSWSADLAQVLDRLFLTDDDEEISLRVLRRALAQLGEAARESGYDDPVSLDLVKLHLRRALDLDSGQSRFLAGGVTFCAMVPMRSIPFAAVCLIGMNADAFPRSHRAPGFDLIERSPRHGDRSRRDDDHYLFLEALLSARRCFYVSYVGRSIRDNSDLPPSVLVSELLDAVRRGFFLAGDEENEQDARGRHLVRHLTIDHPLQPFSRRYFAGDGPLFSYSRELCAAIAAATEHGAEPLPLVRRPLGPLAEGGDAIDLDRFIRFFQNPARWFAETRLAIYLDRSDGLVERSEPFSLDGLAAYIAKTDIVDGALAGRSLDALLALLRGDGVLPHGRLGVAAFDDLCRRTQELVTRLRRLLPDGQPARLSFAAFAAGPVRLSGSLAGVTRDGIVAGRPALVKANDLLALWIRHLVLTRLARAGEAPVGSRLTARHIGSDGAFSVSPVDRADDLLAELGEIYRRGIAEPLRFFPATSLAYARALYGGKDDPFARARVAWEGSEAALMPAGERDNPWVQLLFRGSDPLDERFAELASAIFGPLQRHLAGPA